MLFGRLTERAQRVLAYTRRSNPFKSFKYRYRAFTLGLMKEPEGIAAKVLESFEITEEK